MCLGKNSFKNIIYKLYGILLKLYQDFRWGGGSDGTIRIQVKNPWNIWVYFVHVAALYKSFNVETYNSKIQPIRLVLYFEVHK